MLQKSPERHDNEPLQIYKQNLFERTTLWRNVVGELQILLQLLYRQPVSLFSIVVIEVRLC